MSENKQDSGADAPEPVTKIVIYVRDSKLPDEVRDIIRDPIEKAQHRQILEALLKAPIEQSTVSKTIFIDQKKNAKPKRIQIRRKDREWLDKTKGSRSRSAWLHHVIEAFKKSVEVGA